MQKQSSQIQLQQSNLILNYSLYLNEKSKILFVKIISLENVKLPPTSPTSYQDLNVYVRIDLLVPKDNKATNTSLNMNNVIRKTAKTRFIKNRSNPIYDESFEFDNLNDLFENIASKSEQDDDKCSFRLVFNVCNSNLYGRDQIIGQTFHKLSKNDLVNNEFNKLVDKIDNTSLDLDKSCLSRIYSKKVDLIDSRVRANQIYFI